MLPFLLTQHDGLHCSSLLDSVVSLFLSNPVIVTFIEVQESPEGACGPHSAVFQEADGLTLVSLRAPRPRM